MGALLTNIKEYWDGDINWATLTDTKEKYLYNTSRKITRKGLKNSSAKLLPINPVLFSSRATIGEICINKIPTCTNQAYKNFICKDSDVLYYEYLYYALLQESINIAAIASGATYKEVSKEKILNHIISLPPLHIQQEIAEQQEHKMVEAQKEIVRLFQGKITNKLKSLWKTEKELISNEIVFENVN